MRYLQKNKKSIIFNDFVLDIFVYKTVAFKLLFNMSSVHLNNNNKEIKTPMIKV